MPTLVGITPCQAPPLPTAGGADRRAKDGDRYRFANFTKAQPLFRCLARLGRGKVIPVSVLSHQVGAGRQDDER